MPLVRVEEEKGTVSKSKLYGNRLGFVTVMYSEHQDPGIEVGP